MHYKALESSHRLNNCTDQHLLQVPNAEFNMDITNNKARSASSVFVKVVPRKYILKLVGIKAVNDIY